MMMAFAFASFRARRDQRSPGGRAVLEAMALYHGMAAALNATVGCGIDGRKNAARDATHAIIHGMIALGSVATLAHRRERQGGDEEDDGHEE